MGLTDYFLIKENSIYLGNAEFIFKNGILVDIK